MAEAGFYWCGTEKDTDTVSCFVCGKILDGWEPSDCPWFEHHKHAPQCKFAKLGKPEAQLTLADIYSLYETVMRNILVKQHKDDMKELEDLVETMRQNVIAQLRK